MKNNKGMTLVEIIISIALISIVLLFLFMLLVSVNDINQESEVNSTYLVNKSLILKNVEEDLSNTKSIKLSTCDIKDFYTKYDDYLADLDDNEKANQCIKLTYINDTGSSDAYIGLYYYQNKSEYVISYIHGNVKATRLLPNFEKYNVDIDKNTNEAYLKNNFKIKIGTSYDEKVSKTSDITTYASTSDEFATITIPIIGPDEKDYSIIISYYGIVEIP